MLRRFPWFVLVFACATWCAAGARGGEADPAQIQTWIGDLNSDYYVVRERAMLRLEDAGPTALEALATAADGANLEVASGAVRLLLKLSESKDLEVSSAALERIAALKNRPAEQRAALAVMQGMRARESLIAVMKMGAIEKQRYDIGGQTYIAHLHLGEEWKGGDEGMRRVRDLENVQRLSIHSAPIGDQGLAHLHGMDGLLRLELYGTLVSQAGVEAFRKAMPTVEVDFRGGAMLGVGGMPHPQGAQVNFVQADSAAWKAGIHPGDIITKFNNQGFQGFEGLTAHIARCRPGEKATLELLRDGKVVTKEVQFGQWK